MKYEKEFRRLIREACADYFHTQKPKAVDNIEYRVIQAWKELEEDWGNREALKAARVKKIEKWRQHQAFGKYKLVDDLMC